MQDLQSYISIFESKLSSFSFEKLSSSDAQVLQSSLNTFKELLDKAINSKNLSSIDLHKEAEYMKPLAHANPEGYTAKQLKKESKENAIFLANTGQQFMIPTTGIINATENLLDTNLSDEQKAIVHNIKFSSQLMLDTSQDILEYSNLGITKEGEGLVEFKFYSIIRDVLFLCNTLIMGKNLKIETDIDPNIPSILIGEPEKLSQILMNLIGNAIKHTHEGVILLKIYLKEEYLDNVMLEFEVCDTGKGMAEDDIKYVFDPYKTIYTKEKNNQSDFTLSIVEQLVKNLNGDIYASSRLGVGTVFTFTIPLKHLKMNETIYESNPKSIKDLKILVFEDDDLNQKIIDVKLNKWKCKTFITDNVQEGINIMENNNIDIVLMDIIMPKMSGYEITDIIRNHKDPKLNKIPIIAVTADNIQQNIDAYELSGFNDYLIKPYNSEELFQKLKQHKPKDIEMEKVQDLKVNKATEQKIDLKPILEDCMDNIELLEELIQLYQQNALEFIGKTKVLIASNNFDGIWQCAHKIKSGLAMVGTQGLLSIVIEIEKNTKTHKDTKHINFLYDCFVQEYQQVETQILLELERLKKE